MDITMSLWNKVSVLTEAQAAGGSGRVEPGRVIVDDGSLDGKEVHPAMDGAFYKVTDEVLDLSKVKFVTGTVDGMEMETTYFATDNKMTVNYLYPIMNGEVHDMFIVVVETADREADSGEPVSAGTYILNTGAPWRIEFAETIHPIDPKFLPGGSGTVGEEVWGKTYFAVLMMKAAQRGGLYTESVDTITGADGVKRTCDDLRKLCQNADKICFPMSGYPVECPITAKQYERGGYLQQFAINAMLFDGTQAVEGKIVVNLFGGSITAYVIANTYQ